MTSLCRVYDFVAVLTREKLISRISLFFFFCAYVARKKKSLISRINGHNTSFLISLCKTWFIHVANNSNLQLFSSWGPVFWQQKMSRLLSLLSTMKSWVVLSPLCLLLCHPCTVTAVLSDCSMLISNLCLVSSSNWLWWARTSWEFQSYSP